MTNTVSGDLTVNLLKHKKINEPNLQKCWTASDTGGCQMVYDCVLWLLPLHVRITWRKNAYCQKSEKITSDSGVNIAVGLKPYALDACEYSMCQQERVFWQQKVMLLYQNATSRDYWSHEKKPWGMEAIFTGILKPWKFWKTRTLRPMVCAWLKGLVGEMSLGHLVAPDRSAVLRAFGSGRRSRTGIYCRPWLSGPS